MIKILEEDIDTAFSVWIRARDKECVYPYGTSQYKPGEHAGSLQNSHYYGRGARSVRFDPENCDALCGRHHQFLEERKNAEYLDWKQEQLGEERYKALRERYRERKQWKEQELWDLYLKYSPMDLKQLVNQEVRKLKTKAANLRKQAEKCEKEAEKLLAKLNA